MLRIIFIYFLLVLFSLKGFAQIQEGESLNRIVAVVGKEMITEMDLKASAAMLKQQDPSLDLNDPEVKKEVLDMLINDKLIVTKAIEDSITVTDQEIDQRWNDAIFQMKQTYGSIRRVEQLYKKSIQRIKSEQKEKIRNNILSQKILQTKTANINVSPREVEEFFEVYKDSLQRIPDQVEVYHIVKYVDIKDHRQSKVYQKAKAIRDTLIGGGDFAALAKRNSEDSYTAADGGELGWVERGSVFPEYEDAAFALQVGEVSMPIKTDIGYYIIKTTEKKDKTVYTSHILLKLDQSDTDMQAAKDFLLKLKERTEKGEKFEDLAIEYSEDKDSKGFGGFIDKIPLDAVPENMKNIINQLDVGQISQPLPYTKEDKKPAYHILLKKRFIPAHEPNLDEDYRTIEKYAIENKKMKIYQDWVQELRNTIYWEIK